MNSLLAGFEGTPVPNRQHKERHTAAGTSIKRQHVSLRTYKVSESSHFTQDPGRNKEFTEKMLFYRLLLVLTGFCTWNVDSLLPLRAPPVRPRPISR